MPVFHLALEEWSAPVRKPICHREGWCHQPRVLPEEIIGAKGSMSDERSTEGKRVQLSIAGRKDAHVVNQSQRSSIEAVPMSYVAGCKTRRAVGRRDAKIVISVEGGNE